MPIFLTGDEDAKKSMSFPIVNGMLIETLDETNNRPIAVANGLRSGLARATTLRNEEEDFESESVAGRNLDRTDRFGGVGALGDLAGVEGDLVESFENVRILV